MDVAGDRVFAIDSRKAEICDGAVPKFQANSSFQTFSCISGIF